MKRITDYTNYKFRSHAVGKLMTGVKVGLTEKQEQMFNEFDLRYKGEGRKLTEKQEAIYFELGAQKKAKPELSKTAKTYLEELHRAEFYGRTNHIESAYIDKGLQVESKSITLYSEFTNQFFKSNKERKSNDYICGVTDFVPTDKIREIKSSFSLNSFPMYDTKPTNQDYIWQCQSYMWLHGLNQAELIYCLVDTPYKIIDDELRRLDWKCHLFGIDGEIQSEEAKEVVVEVVSNHIFTLDGLKEYCQQSSNVHIEWFTDFVEIEEKVRVKIFDIEFNPKMIESLKIQIGNARAYLNELYEGN